MFIRTLCSMTALVSAIAATSVAHAEVDYPVRPIDLVVPYAPGGTTDLIARLIASKLGDVLKQPVIVMNRPGAGGAVGSGYAARQKPDGYTIVMAVESSHAVNPSVQKNLPMILLMILRQ